jgi:hypothetical protein
MFQPIYLQKEITAPSLLNTLLHLQEYPCNGEMQDKH